MKTLAFLFRSVPLELEAASVEVLLDVIDNKLTSMVESSDVRSMREVVALEKARRVLQQVAS